MIEKYQTSLKNKLLEYQGKKLYVVDQIFYKSEYYVYVFNLEEWEKNDKLEVNFLKKEGNGELEVVTDMVLFDKLLGTIGIDKLTDVIKDIKI